MRKKRKQKMRSTLMEEKSLSLFRLVTTTRGFHKITVLQNSVLPREPMWQSLIAVKLLANYDLTKRDSNINVFLVMFLKQFFTTEASQIWMLPQ